GLVGRRGIGKSGILFELFKANNTGKHHTDLSPDPKNEPVPPIEDLSCISVWLSIPSKYEEAEFVETVLEQLAFETEKSIARFLGVEEQTIRKLEAQLARAGIWVLAWMLTCLGLLLIINSAMAISSQVFLSWVPVVLLCLIAIGLAIIEVATLEPIDLTSWLE